MVEPRAAVSDAPPLRGGLALVVAAAALITGCAAEIARPPVAAPIAAPPAREVVVVAPPPKEPAPPPEPEPPKGDGPLLALPVRARTMESGTAFLKRTASLGRAAFEREAFEAITHGNVPLFERRLQPVRLSSVDRRGKRHEAIIFVLPDYLAVGSDDDFLRLPMTPATAQRIATLARCSLPTRRLVDEIYKQAKVKLAPKWIDGGPDITNRWEFATHNAEVEQQRAAARVEPGDLTAGDKKDIVISNRLLKHPGKVAIYGWHKGDGRVIQHLSTAHARIYADYSHGVRLVAEDAVVDGEPRELADVLRDPLLAGLVSDEGPLKVVAY
ncbi:MAG TPA: hypothetical protein VGM56_15550 [Byssovorax sp.]